MNKFFKTLGKVYFIALIVNTVVYSVLGVGIIMKDKFGLCNRFTDFCDDVINSMGWGFEFTGKMFKNR